MRARDKASSTACRRIGDDSFGKHLLLTRTLKPKISTRSHFSSPPVELAIICRRDFATALPGEEGLDKRDGDAILALLLTAIKRGRKEQGRREASETGITPLALPDALPPTAVPPRKGSAFASAG